MKINDLSKQLEVTNKELIQYLKSQDFDVSSHMQNATDEMIDAATEYFSKSEETEAEPEAEAEVETEAVEEKPKATSAKKKKTTTEKKSTKTFAPDDLIPCRSVTPWKLNALGVDKKTVYHWENFGDVDYVAYKDLQAMRRKDIITKPKIIIEDPDLCAQWSREIGDIYKPFIGVDYPEQLFDLPDDEFEDLLVNGSDTVREIIKVTAVSMLKAQNYPSLNKLDLIDKKTGTCIKEFV